MDLAAACKRCEAATPGPWEFTDGFYGWDSGVFPVGCEDKLNQSIFANNGHGNGDPTQADAEFIAHARSDLPAALEALEADVKWFVKQWEFYMNCGQRGAAQEVSLLLDDARAAIATPEEREKEKR